MLPRARACLIVAALLGASACARASVADPEAAVREYARAAAAGDADALYAMLSARSRRELGVEQTRRLVLDARRELASQARALGRPETKLWARAVVRYHDGEIAVLDLEDGRFRVGSAGALPAVPRTPAQALEELRRALARRSFGALLRVLSSETRDALDDDVNALVSALEDPGTLNVQVEGDRARVELPDGHAVELRREAGAWRIEDVR